LWLSKTEAGEREPRMERETEREREREKETETETETAQYRPEGWRAQY